MFGILGLKASKKLLLLCQHAAIGLVSAWVLLRLMGSLQKRIGNGLNLRQKTHDPDIMCNCTMYRAA